MTITRFENEYPYVSHWLCLTSNPRGVHGGGWRDTALPSSNSPPRGLEQPIQNFTPARERSDASGRLSELLFSGFLFCSFFYSSFPTSFRQQPRYRRFIIIDPGCPNETLEICISFRTNKFGVLADLNFYLRSNNLLLLFIEHSQPRHIHLILQLRVSYVSFYSSWTT